MLSELEDDDERTHIAADVMTKLWRDPMESGSLLPYPSQAPGGVLAAEESALKGYSDSSPINKFIKLSDWFDAIKRIRPHFRSKCSQNWKMTMNVRTSRQM